MVSTVVIFIGIPKSSAASTAPPITELAIAV
jgi:hypothetical protein